MIWTAGTRQGWMFGSWHFILDRKSQNHHDTKSIQRFWPAALFLDQILSLHCQHNKTQWEGRMRETERERGREKTQPHTTWERFIDLQSRVRRKHRFHLLSLPKENSISERARWKSPGWNLIPPVFCFSSQTCFSFRYLRDSSICRVGKLNAKLRTQNLICRVVESTVWTVQLNLIRMEWCCTTPNNSPCGGQSYQLVVTLNLSYMTPQHQEQGWQLC